jgi:hypothetical protein
MKKSTASEIRNLLNEHHHKTHLPLITLTIELDENGLPNDEVIMTKSHPLEALALVNLLRDHISFLEEKIKKEIRNLQPSKSEYHSKMMIDPQKEKKKKVSEKQAITSAKNSILSNLNFIKNLF